MTVREFIERLHQYPGDLMVLVWDGERRRFAETLHLTPTVLNEVLITPGAISPEETKHPGHPSLPSSVPARP